MTRVSSLEDAVARHIRAGDHVHIVLGHSRWTASAREMARQLWGTNPGLTLSMTSLGALSALFFKGDLVKKVITAYSGNSFPTYTPNPIFKKAYESGRVQVEHWSILTMAQRLEAGARGLPGVVTGSIQGSTMEKNEGFAKVRSPFSNLDRGEEELGLLSPLIPDVSLIHGAIGDETGNIAISEPLLEGVFGAWAAKRGAIATVEKIVPTLKGLGHYVKIPAHRVMAVIETPYGAHPGGCYAPGLGVKSYGEDIPFWIEAAKAALTEVAFEEFAKTYALDPKDQSQYLSVLGKKRLRLLKARSDPTSWKADAASLPIPFDEEISDWERAACYGVAEVQKTIDVVGANAVLAGAGVANLAAWVGVARARKAGSEVVLTAELGLLGYTPTPADPYIFNHRVLPHTSMLCDASTVLGMVIGGPGTVAVGCLGAAEVDQYGNLNSTELGGRNKTESKGDPHKFLVGSGGANDVASRAKACVVVTQARPERLPKNVAYVTSPGDSVMSVVTDKGILRRINGVLKIAAIPSDQDICGSREDRVREFARSCGWEPQVADELEILSPCDHEVVGELRNFDRERVFLR